MGTKLDDPPKKIEAKQNRKKAEKKLKKNIKNLFKLNGPYGLWLPASGPRAQKMSQSLVSRNSNIERRMDSPKTVVGVIRGVA